MFASVIVDIQNSEVDKVFDYLVPLSLDLKAGDRVKVPFGGRLIEGFVVGLKEQSDVPAEKIKEVFCKLDSFSAITPEMLALMEKGIERSEKGEGVLAGSSDLYTNARFTLKCMKEA